MYLKDIIRDEKLYENCYGNRLNENLMFDGQKTTASPNLFKPYFNQYESWRNNGLNLAREKAGTKSLIITMLDLTRYYYNVEITEKIYDKMTVDFCKDIDDLDIIKRLNVSALSKGGFSIHTNPVIMIARC